MKIGLDKYCSITAAAFYLCVLVGCATTTRYPVTARLPDAHKMHFSGKGAGAGMMLMSSMGPMGIAIGVAIDEGIAKDIGETAREVPVDQLAIHAFEAVAIAQQQPLIIDIQEYGFKTGRGTSEIEDAVLPSIKVLVTTGERQQSMELAGEVLASCNLPGWPLARIKTEEPLIRQALQAGFDCLAANYR